MVTRARGGQRNKSRLARPPTSRMARNTPQSNPALVLEGSVAPSPRAENTSPQNASKHEETSSLNPKPSSSPHAEAKKEEASDKGENSENSNKPLGLRAMELAQKGERGEKGEKVDKGEKKEKEELRGGVKLVPHLTTNLEPEKRHPLLPCKNAQVVAETQVIQLTPFPVPRQGTSEVREFQGFILRRNPRKRNSFIVSIKGNSRKGEMGKSRVLETSLSQF